MKESDQTKFWKGDFGDEYTDRNAIDFDNLYKQRYGVTRTEMNKEFLADLPKDAKILEFGCDIGRQLEILEKAEFSNLWGIEINKKAVYVAREHMNWTILEGSFFEVPFKNDLFDLTLASGILIHIHPNDIPGVMDELHRTSKKYIWCFEYFSEECKEIEYRDNKDRLWKNNFLQLFLDRFPDLKVVKKKKYKYIGEENEDMMFLVEKTGEK